MNAVAYSEQQLSLFEECEYARGGRYPRFFVWENVPGAFSSNRGMDFQAVLEEIGESKIPMPQGNRWATAGLVQCPRAEIAWRVLDAQYWGVPQRRRRIFLVADFAAHDRRAGEILFEPEGVCGDSATSKVAEEGTTRGAEDCARIAVYDMTHADEVMRPVKGGIVPTLNARMGTGGNQVPVVHAYEIASAYGVNGFSEYKHGICSLSTSHRNENLAVCTKVFSAKTFYAFRETNIAATLLTGGAFNGGGSENLALSYSIVRRLTPTECERLQGLEDGYTEGGSDTARYKALGNGMAQPCADYVIRRIAEVTRAERKESNDR